MKAKSHLKLNVFIIWLAVLCVWLAIQSSALATPYTSNLDPLIAELQARSAALADSTNKTEIKLKKAIDKILLSFEKPSPNLMTDIKLLGNAAKSLAKLFPDEFVPAPLVTITPKTVVVFTNLDEIIQIALDAYGGDIYTLSADAQNLVNLAPASSCRDKAQAVLDDVADQLALLPSAPNNATAVKILSTAAKNVLKGQTLAETVATCGNSGGGGGGGGNWYDLNLSVTIDGTKISAYENVLNSSPDQVSVTYFANGGLSVYMTKQAGYPYFYFSSNIGNPGGGTHAIYSGGNYSDGVNTYTITDGTITITKWPSSFPGNGKATFSFNATGTAGTITATSGSFSVWIYPPF